MRSARSKLRWSGRHEVGGQGGVADDALDGQTTSGEGGHRALRVVEHLRAIARSPANRRARRALRGRRPRGRTYPAPPRRPWPGRALRRRPRPAPNSPTTCSPAVGGRVRRAATLPPPARPGARRPGRSRLRPRAPARRSVLNSRSRSTRNSSPSNTWWTCSRSQERSWRSSRLTGSSRSSTSRLSRRLRITPSRWSRRLSPGLAADGPGVRDDAVEAAVRGEPLRGGLLAHPGDAGQVVAALADQGRELRVRPGGTPYRSWTAGGVIRISSLTPRSG